MSETTDVDVVVPGAQDQQDPPAADQPGDAPASTTDDAIDPALQERAEALAKSMAQKRIKELVNDRETERRGAQEWQRRSVEMARELQRMLDQQGKQQAAPPANDEPKPEQFTSYEAYLEARTSRTAERRADEIIEQKLAENARAQRQHAAQVAAQAVMTRAVENITSVREKYPDFDAVYEANGDMPMTAPMAAAIAKMGSVGGDVTYHLMKNPQLAGRIATLDPLEQAMELGTLKAALGATQGKTVSSAPPPGKPAGTRSAPSNAFREDVEGTDPRAFDQWYERNFGKVAARK